MNEIIKMLQKQKDLIVNLIEKEDDEAQIKAYGKDLEELDQKIGYEKAKIEMAEEKAKKEQDEAVKAAKSAKTPRVEVGENPNYMGFNINKEIDLIKKDLVPNISNSKLLQKRIKENPEGTRKMVKLFARMAKEAFENPVMGRKAAMQEGTESEGGALVPTEERAELLHLAREKSIALQEATVIQMTSNLMTIPAELTNVSVAITAEEGQATETEPTFAEVDLTAKRVDGWGYVSKELFDDAFVHGGITAMLLDQFIEAMGKKIDSAVFIGTGDPMSGIFLAAGYSTVFDTGSTNFSELLEVDLREAIADIAPADLSTERMKWYGSPQVFYNYVMGLQDSQNRPLFYDGRTGGGVPPKLLGFDVRMSSQTPSTSAAETGMLCLGDLKGVAIGERNSNLQMVLDPYTRMDYHQYRFGFFTRWAFALGLSKLFSRIATGASS